MPGGLGLESLLEMQQKRRGTSASCATRSQQFVERMGLSALLLPESFLGVTAQFYRVSGDFFLPGGFVLKRLHNLRSYRVLLFPRKSSHLAQSVFEQPGHDFSIAVANGFP